MKKTFITSFASLFIIFVACNQENKEAKENLKSKINHKEVVYHVFTRLFDDFRYVTLTRGPNKTHKKNIQTYRIVCFLSSRNRALTAAKPWVMK